MGRRPVIDSEDSSFAEEYEKVFGLLERDDFEKEFNLGRSGSAPPTVEGSLSAVGGMYSGDLGSNPDYLSYYFSNGNTNPRLPPPSLSREDWRLAQRLQGGSSVIGDRRKVNRNDSNNGRPMPPGFNSNKQEGETDKDSLEWGIDELIGMPGSGLRNKQKSLVDIFEDNTNNGLPAREHHPSRPASRNDFDGNSGVIDPIESELPMHSSASNILNSPVTHPAGPPASYSYAAALGSSLSRNSTPDSQRIARAPSPCPSPIGGGRTANLERRNGINNTSSFNRTSSHSSETDLVDAFSGMNLLNGIRDQEKHLRSGLELNANDHKNYLFTLQGGQNDARQQTYMGKHESGRYNISSNSGLNNGNGPIMQKNNISSNVIGSGLGLHSQYQHVDSPNSSFTNYGFGGLPASPVSGQLGSSNFPPLYGNAAAASAMGVVPGMDSRMLGRSNIGSATSEHNLYLQYLKDAEYNAAQLAAVNDYSVNRNYVGRSHPDLQKAYLENLISQSKSHYGVPLGGKTGASNHHGYYTNPSYGVGLSYPGSPLRHDEFNTRILRNLAGQSFGPWHLDNSSFPVSLLEEFKSNKAKCFELLDIIGHVVEFSADQYGSRFIQQKLETATDEDKDMVFQEISPHALVLMTDVFGNYVIQKFLEHGMASHRRELAGRLIGHVLNLSLQMYGCRVIQKAIEVADMDQKIQMVEEVDGHVMRCVRDQNGNHVIQKCIECVPEEHIQFIVVTFFDQVLTLSTHPYGCRVIQRVLEHCKDEKTQSKVMEEILGAVSMLAQDQYGNYVVQHVLEHGKPHERSQIIQELAGRIVQMSQQKFASNVVEKCLTFGEPRERQLLVNEMLGTTDENEPLQAMMKDQFANYVVQKVLETCSDQERELILSRIKVHLNALKKYTYGKHIVARVEKLVTAGERRMAAQSMSAYAA